MISETAVEFNFKDEAELEAYLSKAAESSLADFVHACGNVYGCIVRQSARQTQQPAPVYKCRSCENTSDTEKPYLSCGVCGAMLPNE